MACVKHMMDLTHEILKHGYAEASNWKEKRYKAAMTMWALYADVLECEERPGSAERPGETVLVMVHRPNAEAQTPSAQPEGDG